MCVYFSITSHTVCGCSLPHWVVPPCLCPPSCDRPIYCTHLCTQGNFFQNLGSIVMFAVCGTAISALIVGGGTYILGLVSRIQAHLFSRVTLGFWHLQCSMCWMWLVCICIGHLYSTHPAEHCCWWMLVTVYVCAWCVCDTDLQAHELSVSVLLQISIVDRLDVYQRWALIIKHSAKQQFLVH